jgi:hypothetical protein
VPISNFLRVLAERTRHGWRHLFLTTNWDFLLQREVLNFVPENLPSWLLESHVFHLNGTVEDLDDNSHRSSFILRDDEERKESLESNLALSQMVWGSTFVVVGMCYECEADKALFNILTRVREKLPSGESSWMVVNPCQADLDNACKLIKRKLPHSSVTPVCRGFTQWQAAGFPELKEEGIFCE